MILAFLEYAVTLVKVQKLQYFPRMTHFRPIINHNKP